MTYHILNGDALAERFPEEIEGKHVIIRECLIEGPLNAENPNHFLSIRENYLSQTYPEHGEDYYAKFSKPELEKLSAIPSDSTIYLWFEEDLFCLMNAWYVLYLLSNAPSSYQVYWVHPPMSMHYGFGGLSPDELKRAPEHAKKVGTEDLKIAAKLWEHIATENYDSILKLKFSNSFNFLNTGIQLLLNVKVERKVESLLNELITNIENPEFGAVFRKFHSTAPEYGLGDLQVKRLYDRIMNL